MANSRSQYDLFGLDLLAVGAFFRKGWKEALGWRALRWLNPRPPVRVFGPDGRVTVRLGVSSVPVDFKGKVDRLAAELPEDLVLRRSVSLPPLPDAELTAAVALEARTSSPFPEGDLAWGHARRESRDGRPGDVEVVLCSRAQVSRHLATLGVADEKALEVWAGGARPIVIDGFGRPAGSQGRWMRVLVVLSLLLAFGLLAAIAVTPALQLRFRLFDAVARHDVLVKKAKPQTDLRADLVKANADLESVAEFVAGYSNPLLILDELSRVLPDDAMLNTLEIKREGVRISGIAVNAARLLELLAAQPGYTEVKAPSATSRVPGTNKEVFTIEFKVRRGEVSR